MPKKKSVSVTCRRCQNKVQIDDDFCPNCGELIARDTRCELHSSKPADGVCIICTKPCCSECGHWVNGRFLCNEHDDIEIYEGMARAFGTSDPVQVEHAKDSLERADFHPFVYSRKASPLSVGGPDYSMFRASGEYNGHLINEYKLMVPCQEYPEAIKLLKRLRFIR